MNNTAKSEIKIVNDFTDNEKNKLLSILEDSNYRINGKTMSDKALKNISEAGSHYFKMEGTLKNGEDEILEDFLENIKVPFTRWTEAHDGYDYELAVFDGVRKNIIPSSSDKKAMVEMRVLREVLDELEEDVDSDMAVISLLGLVNFNWVDDDINNFYKYGMKDSIEIRKTDGSEDDVIDVEAEDNQ